jgi:phospholipid/cholesterol/gamma-HCH transport system substrate-binding protein
VLSETKSDFAADLKDFYPVIKALNDNADDLIKDLTFLPTFPFDSRYLRNAIRGDYMNVFVTFDLTLRRLGESVFTTSKGLDPNMKHMDEVVNTPDFLTGAMANLSGQAADPFKIPPGTATQHDGGTP